MAENPLTTVYKNVLTWRGSEKLYLDRETCDVFFVFNTKSDGCVKVPAHKCILSAISPAFHGMFFGPSKQDGDIEIIDSTPEAFKEFLQFFYRSSVELTAENIANVMNLGKQYLIDECVKASAEFCEETLTMVNLCWNYELAILFDVDELKTQCEQQIRENPKGFFGSDSFLICESNMLRHILRSDSLNFEAVVIFDGFIAWAKAKCKRNDLDECDMANIRSQLSDLFYEIPFDQMTHEEFHECDQLYSGLLSSDEFKEITKMIENQNFNSTIFKRSSQELGKRCIENRRRNLCRNTELLCNRLVSFEKRKKADDSVFHINTQVLMTKITLNKHANDPDLVPVRIVVLENPTDTYMGDLCSYAETSLSRVVETDVELLSPVKIKPGVKYVIEIKEISNNYSIFSNTSMQRKVYMEQGIIVNFIKPDYYSNELVKSLHFAPQMLWPS